ncbi:MAG: hypothetical protein LBS74_07510 [Oscillospiraceae bacterium]|jgi:hypothetical protein|nr:hypothetical protein [Oscillospiraceae bacterium]
MAEATTKEQLLYKGRPLLRCGNEIYYGNMTDKYIVHIVILSSKRVNDLDVPNQLSVQLMYTDPDIRLKDRIVKTSEKEGLYRALEIGTIWLERALSGK